MKDTIVSKAEIARQLGLNKSTIGRYCQRGLPTRADGRLNRQQALAWIKQNISSNGGGWGHRGKPNTSDLAGAALHGCPAPATPATTSAPAELVQDDEAAGYRTLLDRLSTEAARIPELALKAGVKDIDVVAALPEAFIETVFYLAGDPITDAAYDWLGDDDLPHRKEPNYRTLAKRYGLSKPNPKRADELLEAFCGVIDSLSLTTV